MREPIVISWEEWQASREIKRSNLAKFGLDGSSRRLTDYGTAGARMRRAFGGKRAPEFNVSARLHGEDSIGLTQSRPTV